MEQASKKLRGGLCTCLTELEVAAKGHPGLLQEEQAPQQAVEQEPEDQCASIRARQCVPPVVLTICTASLTSFVSARKMPGPQGRLVVVQRAAGLQAAVAPVRVSLRITAWIGSLEQVHKDDLEDRARRVEEVGRPGAADVPAVFAGPRAHREEDPCLEEDSKSRKRRLEEGLKRRMRHLEEDLVCRIRRYEDRLKCRMRHLEADLMCRMRRYEEGLQRTMRHLEVDLLCRIRHFAEGLKCKMCLFGDGFRIGSLEVGLKCESSRREDRQDDHQEVQWEDRQDDRQEVRWEDRQDAHQEIQWEDRQDDHQEIQWEDRQDDHQEVRWEDPQDAHQEVQWEDPQDDHQEVRWEDRQDDRQEVRWEDRQDVHQEVRREVVAELRMKTPFRTTLLGCTCWYIRS
ncbi:Immunoglobulin G-binding protein A [Aphelenchoides avenae]|nr:Immunoglobulin G-binding protein A [Aphelenchus avenae]